MPVRMLLFPCAMSRSSRAACVIAGHSHTWALGFPKVHPEGRVGLLAHPDDERFVGLKGPGAPDQHYWDELVQVSRAHPVALTWCGNQHFIDFMFAPTPAFDFAVASRPDLPIDDSVLLVPELVVREFYAPSLAELPELIAKMRALNGPGLVLLEAPPPREHPEKVRWQLFDRPYFAELAARLGSDVATIPLAPALLHLKLWQVIQDMLRALAEAQGIGFLPCPADAKTSTGFLREELGSNDLTHGNQAYGAMVLRDLAACLAADHERLA